MDSSGPAVLVDPLPHRDAWKEGTRVRVEQDRAVAFGKLLDEPAVDCGAFVLTSEVFACQRSASAQGDESLAGAVTRLAEGGVRASDDPVHLFSHDLGDEVEAGVVIQHDKLEVVRPRPRPPAATTSVGR